MITNSTTLQKEKEPVPPLVKVRDVARLLSVSRSTVRNLIDSGELEGSRINPCEKRRNHLRVTRESLLKFYRNRFGHSLTRALANPFES
ncbi:MAG TPA: helix-turn-helix domain-containing protein [Candidatus Methylacidiphilales bacterium]|nr:helix-turn-helix domain-containing protein [Candidatus Methylacidiphilales bacterium]